MDWAWPTLGAPWIDPACAVLWLIAEGHTPATAEAWAHELPGWHHVPHAGLDVFAAVNAGLWARIAENDPQPWKLALREAGSQWQTYRRS